MFSYIYDSMPSLSFFGSANNQPQVRRTNDETLGEDWTILGEEESTVDFVKKSPLPTAYSKSIAELKYDYTKPLGTSSHDVFMGEDAYKQPHFIKINHNPAMVYCEAFLGQLYSLSLLYGVAQGVARHDINRQAVAVSSKGLNGFKTFKNEPLTLEQLNDENFRKRFIRILAIFFRIHEDDGHHGNITTSLQTFDADCALWDATYLIKGGRPNVDNVILRNPETAFTLSEEDVVNFPDISTSQLWYFPSQTNYYTGMASTNPWSLDATNHVKTLKNKPETLAICFEEYIDWMLDLSIRLPHIAALNIPANLKVGETDQSIIDLYCKTNEKIDKEYWDILPTIPEFQNYVNNNSEEILLQILIRCLIRNQRLMKDKKNAHEHFKQQFDNAMVKPVTLINLFNKLASIVTKNTTFCTSNIISLYKTEIIQSINIDNNKGNELLQKSILIAKEMIALEEQIGTEEWLPFCNPSSQKTHTTTSCKK